MRTVCLLLAWLALGPWIVNARHGARNLTPRDISTYGQSSTTTSSITTSTSSSSTVTPSATPNLGLGTFYIPTESPAEFSSGYRPNLTNTFRFQGSFMVFNLWENYDFPADISKTITDAYGFPGLSSFSDCIQACAAWNIDDNLGTIDNYKGCTAVSWKKSRCFIKTGVIDSCQDTVEVDSAVLTFMTP